MTLDNDVSFGKQIRMEELYNNSHSIESGSQQKKYFGIQEKIVHVIGVMVFYILIFFTISLLSNGFNALSKQESPEQKNIQAR